MTKKELYDRRKAARQCVACGAQDSRTLSGRAYCIRHAAAMRKRQRESYERIKKAGCCVKCGKPLKDNTQRVTCFECAVKQSEYEMKYRRKKKTAKRGNA